MCISIAEHISNLMRDMTTVMDNKITKMTKQTKYYTLLEEIQTEISETQTDIGPSFLQSTGFSLKGPRR